MGPRPSDPSYAAAAGKADLRRRCRAARRDLPAAARGHAQGAIHALLDGLGELAGEGPVLAYAAAGHEVDLDPWLRALLARGWPLRLPRVAGDELEVVAVHDLDRDLVPGWRGLREPAGGRDAGLADLAAVVVPGVAFDPGGGRLGQGGGHVDRLLARIDRGQTTVVGVCFAVQLVAAVPREGHDAPMDVVVTEQGAYRRG